MNQYDEKGLVICQECGKSFGQITVQHLKLHNMSQAEYKTKYPNYSVTGKPFRAKQKFKNIKIFNDSPSEIPLPEEIKIEETNEFDLDKIPIVSKEFANDISAFIEEVKTFTEEDKIHNYPDPTNSIHKDKLKILNFLLFYFKDLKNSYFIEKKNIFGILEYRLITDICIPSRKINIEFPNTFWHNRDIPKDNRDNMLKNSGWRIIDINTIRPTVTDVKNALKKFNLI
jgi:hypothetical protein